MKRIFNSILVFAAALALTCGFSSCSKKDGEETKDKDRSSEASRSSRVNDRVNDSGDYSVSELEGSWVTDAIQIDDSGLEMIIMLTFTPRDNFSGDFEMDFFYDGTTEDSGVRANMTFSVEAKGKFLLEDDAINYKINPNAFKMNECDIEYDGITLSGSQLEMVKKEMWRTMKAELVNGFGDENTMIITRLTPKRLVVEDGGDEMVFTRY